MHRKVRYYRNLKKTYRKLIDLFGLFIETLIDLHKISKMQEQIFKDLEKIGHKFSKIEEELEMPKNYLSRFKNPENSLPGKWVDPLLNYIQRHTISEAPLSAVYPITPEEVIPVIEPKTELVVDKAGVKEKPSKEAFKELRLTMDKINKDFGAGAVMFLGESTDNKMEVVPTGSLSLDHALGIGGLPRGRIVEIYGPESSGKTTLTIHVIAEAQKLGLTCAFIDMEHAFDPEYATNLGVNIDTLLTSQPDYGEQALEIMDRLVTSGLVHVVVLDSVAALVPKAELEGEMGDSKMGLHARLMSQACRKLTGIVSKTNTLCIFINQIRMKIGIVMGNPEVVTGGQALKFYSSIRMDVRKTAQIKDGEESVGNRTKVKVIKNKCAPPFKSAEFDIIYGEGINKTGELLDMATLVGIVIKSGSWYSYNGTKLGQGRDGVAALLKDNPEMIKELSSKINGSYVAPIATPDEN
jgi:recombination protein RecA